MGNIYNKKQQKNKLKTARNSLTFVILSRIEEDGLSFWNDPTSGVSYVGPGARSLLRSFFATL